jgi:hypothetical protein
LFFSFITPLPVKAKAHSFFGMDFCRKSFKLFQKVRKVRTFCKYGSNGRHEPTRITERSDGVSLIALDVDGQVISQPHDLWRRHTTYSAHDLTDAALLDGHQFGRLPNLRETRWRLTWYVFGGYIYRHSPSLYTLSVAFAMTGWPAPLSAVQLIVAASSAIMTGSMRSDTLPPVSDTRCDVGGVTVNLRDCVWI